MKIPKQEEKKINKILKQLGLPKKRVAKELVKAYADTPEVQSNYKYRYEPPDQVERDLDWRASEPVNGEELTDLMCKVVSSYNLFDCDKHTKKLAKKFPDAEFYMAREGSVAIYIDGDYKKPTDLESLCRELQADECYFPAKDRARSSKNWETPLSDLDPKQIWKKDQFRIWWD